MLDDEGLVLNIIGNIFIKTPTPLLDRIKYSFKYDQELLVLLDEMLNEISN